MTEDDIQKAFFLFVRKLPIKGICTIHHIPNGGYRHPAEAKKFKAIGVLPGVADVFWPMPNEEYHGLYIEFKTPKGTQTENQRAFQRNVEENGYKYVICRNYQAAINEVLSYAGYELRNNERKSKSESAAKS